MSNVSNNPENREENSAVSSRATVSARELISVCRQIGGMMEAGVDILRVTRVLRAQTKNPRLLEWYDQFDHELTMGRGLPEALAQAPDLFSPFAVSLVRQGEERNDLSSAFLRVADFLAKEHENSDSHTTISARQVLAAPAAPSDSHGARADYSPNVATPHFVPANSPDRASENAPWWWRRASLLGAGVLGALAFSEALVAAGWLDERWGRVARNALGAGVLGAFAVAEKTAFKLPAPNAAYPNSTTVSEPDSPLASPEGAISEIEKAKPEISSPRNLSALPDNSPTPLQRVPSWDAEADTTRRVVRRPTDEEDFE